MAPNTTQIPNNLFNGEMAKMKDTELRITLLVARKTLGWIENFETGMRKEEDWISRYQLMQFTGKTGRAISTAIENCIKRGWIEARDKKGELLNTPQKRGGKKIFYRLGEIFLDKVDIIKTSEKSSQVKQTSEKSAGEKSAGEKSALYKRNPEEQKKPYLQKNTPVGKTDNQKNQSTEEEEEEEEEEKVEPWTKSILKWYESEFNIKLAIYDKQLGALGLLKKAGYSPDEIKKAIKKMWQEPFWIPKHPDFMDLAKHINRYARKTNQQNDSFKGIKIKEY